MAMSFCKYRLRRCSSWLIRSRTISRALRSCTRRKIRNRRRNKEKKSVGISLNPSTLLNGQGIDVNSLVQQVLGESTGQLSEWQNEQSTLQTQASDLTGINNDLGTLAKAVQALSDPLGALTAVTADSSDSSILTADATTAASASRHQITVSTLATSGLVYTDSLAAGADTSILPGGATSGEIDLQIGGNSGTAQKIAITAGSNDTL